MKSTDALVQFIYLGFLESYPFNSMFNYESEQSIQHFSGKVKSRKFSADEIDLYSAFMTMSLHSQAASKNKEMESRFFKALTPFSSVEPSSASYDSQIIVLSNITSKKFFILLDLWFLYSIQNWEDLEKHIWKPLASGLSIPSWVLLVEDSKLPEYKYVFISHKWISENPIKYKSPVRDLWCNYIVKEYFGDMGKWKTDTKPIWVWYDCLYNPQNESVFLV